MSADRLASRVLLIGWDAADWKFINPLLDAGRMPNLSRLVDHGVIGNLATLHPCLSPILWTSIATGKTADKHGIAGFVEPIPGGAGLRWSSSTSRTTKAIWNILSQEGLSSIVINWYASHPAEAIRGTCVSNQFFEGYPRQPDQAWTVTPGSVHPPSLGPALADLRMHPTEFGLPEMSRFIPNIQNINLSVDSRPWKLAETLARTVSIHCVATDRMQAESWDFLAVYYDGLDVAGHTFMPFHAPKLPWIGEEDFVLYQHVMQELYLFHDEMLGRLLDLAGDETTVILLSDHGFHCDHLRPAQADDSPEALAALWHRNYGVLAMRGPGLLRDDRVYGATLLDITPTVLNLFGLPVGRDMDGRPLLQAYENPPKVVRAIASWDQKPGDDGRRVAEHQQSMMETPAAVEQLIALGYLPAETAETQRAVATAVAEARFNLAIVHSSLGRPREAVKLLKELHESQPDHTRYAVALAKTYANLGDYQQCLTLVERLEAKGWRSAEGDLLAAGALFNTGETDKAVARLAECERQYPPNPVLYGMVGRIHSARQSWSDAAAAYEKSLALDDDQPQIHDALAQAALKLEDFEKAADHALRAVGLLFYFPQAHFHLGMAFKRMGETDRAIRSLKLAISQAPRFMEAHHELELLQEEISQARRRAAQTE